jgi:hypothetical protein
VEATKKLLSAFQCLEKKMIALRQFKRVPNDHRLVIEVPESIEENQLMEVILLSNVT